MATNKEEPKNQLNKYLKYSTLAFQMGAIIGGFVWLGDIVDSKYQLTPEWGKVGFSLFGIGCALYFSLKGLIEK